jgi:Ulp1 family protease
MGDIKRLEPLEFLNDNLVDVYLKYMMLERRTVPPRASGWGSGWGAEGVGEPRDHIHVFSSHFYKKLTELGNRRGRKRSGGLPGADAHALVARWTKGIDVFSKKSARAFPLFFLFHRLPSFPLPNESVLSFRIN